MKKTLCIKFGVKNFWKTKFELALSVAAQDNLWQDSTISTWNNQVP